MHIWVVPRAVTPTCGGCGWGCPALGERVLHQAPAWPGRALPSLGLETPNRCLWGAFFWGRRRVMGSIVHKGFFSVEGSEQGDAASSGNSRGHNLTPDAPRGLSGAAATCAQLCVPPSKGRREEFPAAAQAASGRRCSAPSALCGALGRGGALVAALTALPCGHGSARCGCVITCYKLKLVWLLLVNAKLNSFFTTQRV